MNLLPSDENTKSLKKRLLEIAKEKLGGEQGATKEKFEGYEERFPMRPFYGEGIKKLPKVSLKTLTADYENIFVNEQLSNKEEDAEILKNNIFTVVDFLKQKFNYENEEIKQVLVRSMKIFNFSNEELEERFEEIKMTYSIGDNSLKLIL